tara:strand:- start:406 stop:780 length:375 start_codon:yes stop_codon:yes gene_type:complete
MSTITVTNIKATGETASRAVSGVAGAWVNFNGTGTIAARDSLNVASLTDSSTGNYVVNFSNNFGDGNFSAVAIQGNNDASNAGVNATIAVGHTASSASGIETSNLSSSNIDYEQISAVYHGDLA